MLQSRNRLLSDIGRWEAAGWITTDGATAIRRDIAARRSGIGLAGVLATLAAVLVGFGVMSFVAANWQEMSKLARLLVIAAGLWSAFGGAAWLQARSHPYFANAALLAGVSIFGAGIMLIAQMYHMDGHPPDAVLLWGAGALATGLLTRSNAALAAALSLFCLWSLMESEGYLFAGRIHWPFLLPWAIVAAGYAMTRWRPGLHLLAISLSGWIVLTGYTLDRGRSYAGHFLVAVIGFFLMVASVLAGPTIDRWREISGAMLAYGFAIAFMGALGLQFVADTTGAHTLFLGSVALVGIVATLWWAWRTDNRAVHWLAYGAFSIEIFSIYVKKVGTLLGTSAFFLATGILVGALAWVAFRLHQQTLRAEGGAP